MFKQQLISFLIFIACAFQTNAQLATNNDFNNERLRINKTGMVVLTSWASTNIAVGSIGWAYDKGAMKYFHQMNVFWNIVNLGIAVPGLFQSRKYSEEKISNGKLIEEQYANEQLYLINDGLNILYIGSGFLLKSIADTYPDNQLRFEGYGNSLILQGGFLLVFDLVQYLRHRNHRKKSNAIFFDQLSLSNSGIGLKYSFK
jgi:hypothetical protein